MQTLNLTDLASVQEIFEQVSRMLPFRVADLAALDGVLPEYPNQLAIVDNVGVFMHRAATSTWTTAESTELEAELVDVQQTLTNLTIHVNEQLLTLNEQINSVSITADQVGGLSAFVRGTTLTGLNLGNAQPVVAGITLLDAVGRLQRQITDAVAALNLKANLANPSFIGRVVSESSQVSTSISALPGADSGFESRARGSSHTAGAATIGFHRPDAYIVHFGLDTDNKLKVGGGSLGANAYAVYHENNKPTKVDVGLGNVDNTSDADKPISAATQAALNTKVDKAGLGTAAYAALTTWALDTTPGRVMRVGDFGLGEYNPILSKSQENTLLNGRSTFYSTQEESDLLSYAGVLQIGHGYPGYATQIASQMGVSVPILKVRVLNNNVWGQPVTLLHTNNLAQGVGSSIEYPMSQAAVTNAILHPTPVAASGGVMDCALGNHFVATISANITLSFANIPGGAYSCVLEVQHTAGTIAFPTGTVWAGSAPTLFTGKRHLFFFQRAQLGTAGWYASALPGYSA